VLILTQDDSEAQILDRLEALDADLDRIIVSDEGFALDTKGVGRLHDYSVYHDIAITFLDPLLDYTEVRDSNHAKEVSRAMATLREVAIRTNTTIMGVRHKRKPRAGDPPEKKIYAGQGSMLFLGKARTVLQVSDLGNGVSGVDHIKCNYAPKGSPSAYTIVDGRLVWTKRPPPCVNKTPKARDRWLRFFGEQLKDGPKTSHELQLAAEAAGLSWSNVSRDAKGIAEPFTEGGQHLWRLLLWEIFEDEDGTSSSSRIAEEQVDPELAEQVAAARAKLASKGLQ
jgi:hypothetical protein